MEVLGRYGRGRGRGGDEMRWESRGEKEGKRGTSKSSDSILLHGGYFIGSLTDSDGH